MKLWPMLVLASAAFAQGDSKAATPRAAPPVVNVRDLSNERRQLDDEVHSLQQQAEKLQRDLDRVREAQNNIRGFKGDLVKNPKNQYAIEALQGWEDELKKFGAEDPSNIEERIKSELANTKNSLRAKQADLAQVESELNDRVDVESKKQSYKLYLSGAFTGLIGLVIGGFYLLAAKDPKVRASIFSGESGLQFITLFSLVIAIILFGLTEVLEGKELSALLGGLSGYILGRSGRPGGTSGKGAEGAGEAPQKTAESQAAREPSQP